MAEAERGFDISPSLLREAMKTEWFVTIRSGSAIAAMLPDRLRFALAVATAERAAEVARLEQRAAAETARERQRQALAERNRAEGLRRQAAQERAREQQRREAEAERSRLARERRDAARVLRIFLAVCIVGLAIDFYDRGSLIVLLLLSFFVLPAIWSWVVAPFQRTYDGGK